MSLLLLLSGAGTPAAAATATVDTLRLASPVFWRVRPTVGISDFIVDENNSAILDHNDEPIIGALSLGTAVKLYTPTLKVKRSV